MNEVKAGVNGKKPIGRPTKRTAELDEVILRALRLGLGYATAAELAGVRRETLLDWRHKDESFGITCKRAQAEAKTNAAAALWKRIQKGSDAATIFFLKTRTEEFREKRELDDLVREMAARMFGGLIDRVVAAKDGELAQELRSEVSKIQPGKVTIQVAGRTTGEPPGRGRPGAP